MCAPIVALSFHAATITETSGTSAQFFGGSIAGEKDCSESTCLSLCQRDQLYSAIRPNVTKGKSFERRNALPSNLVIESFIGVRTPRIRHEPNPRPFSMNSSATSL